MTEFSKITGWSETPNPLAQKITELKKSGRALLDLTVTNPTQCGFQYFDSALLGPLLAQQNLNYEADAHGLLSAREAVCRYYAEKGVRLKPDQIFLTASTSEAYSFLFKLLLNPNESILSPAPSYPLLDYLCELNHVRSLRYELPPPDWKFTRESLDKAMAPDTRAVLTVHPNNPTGNYVSNEERDTLIKFCGDKNLAVISDEVFFDYKFGEKGGIKSFAAVNGTLTFTLSGISKILGLPQMKLSWIVVAGPEKEKREAIRRLEIIADTYISASTPIQNALPAWMEKKSEIQSEICGRLNENLATLKASSLNFLLPQGGWNAVLQFPDSKSDEDWALDLLENSGVLVHPGYLYDFKNGSCLILGLLVPPKVFKEGLDRITPLHPTSESTNAGGKFRL